MDLRSTINKHPRTTLGVLSGILVLILAISVSGWLHVGIHRSSAGAFYTDDDGNTLFTAAPGLITPFDHNGKPAVMAMVYTADGGQHHWVQYLQKCTDESAQKLASIAGTDRPPTPGQMMAAMPQLLVKKPGAEKWLLMSDPAARQLMQPTIPEGMGTGPIELAPR